MSDIVLGDCLEVMAGMETASIDAVVTDPPYGLSFMGEHWDHGVPGVAFWTEALRVLKPGARLLAFGGTRTYHRLTCAIEDAGFQIGDSIGYLNSGDDEETTREIALEADRSGLLGWVYGSGFPKHASKLKPAWEPIVMARKPAPKATALNIDACRIAGTVPKTVHGVSSRQGEVYGHFRDEPEAFEPHASGRWPANVVLDEEAANALDEQSGKLSSHDTPGEVSNRCGTGMLGTSTFAIRGRSQVPAYGDTGGASRFFFVAREPNAITPNDPLILRRAKAILWAWNPDLANTADDHSSLSNQHAVSVLSRVVIAASHGDRQLSGLTGLSTSVTPSELSALCQSVIALILSSANESSHEQRRGGLTLSNGHANGAGTHGPTDTTTAMIGRSTFDGSAVVATLTATSNSSDRGEADSVSSRLLYCAKASRSEREAGLEGFTPNGRTFGQKRCAHCGRQQVNMPGSECRCAQPEWVDVVKHSPRANGHPTVKPVALMRWLVRLVTPPDGVVLDPFTGSGTTGIAATLEGRRFVGIEREAEYVEIARARIAHAQPALGVA